MQNNAKRRGVSLLLIVGLLIVALAAIIPLAIAADGAPAQSGEIEDLGYQTLLNADVHDSVITDLRFFFTIPESKLLEYSDVGFVLSKSNDEPVIGAAGCKTVSPNEGKVYRSINTDGGTKNAPAGRYYVAVKLTNVPHEYFDGALYVRAFVTDCEGTRYSEAKFITVCSALGHVHTVSGSASQGSLSRIGHCDGCGLDGVKELGVTNPDVKKWTKSEDASKFVEDFLVSDILGGGHFYPDGSNENKGNDLLIEYSVLWNPTLLNLTDSAFIDTRFGNSSGGDNKGVCYWSLADAVSNSDSPFSGSFEYSGLRSVALDGASYTPAGMVPPSGSSYTDYPNIGGADRLNPEWGWHRISIRVHQEVMNLADLKADNSPGATPAEYYITSTTYIDGAPVSKLCGDSLVSNGGTHYELFHCTSDGVGGVTYSDDYLQDKYLFAFYVNSTKSSVSSPAYFASGDSFATAGHNFVQNVKRIDNPDPRIETVDGNDLPGAFWYTIIGAHEHDWDGVYTLTHTSNMLEKTEVEHCLICGQAHNERESSVALVPNVQVWTDSSTGTYELKTSLKAARDGQHFYPAASNDYEGNDLLVEYSILWNESLLNLDGEKNPNVTTKIGRRQSDRNNNIVYWSPTADTSGADCVYAGGFEYGTMRISEPGNPYPRMIAEYADITAYPNIGGSNFGDESAQVNTEYGWHRVSIRLHQELTNEDTLKNSAKDTPGEYKCTTTIYIDGVLVSILSSTDIQGEYTVKENGVNVKKYQNNRLFTATSDGEGGITYSDASKDKFVFALQFNSIQTKDDKTAYCAIADVYVTCGKDFVQEVVRVDNPSNDTISLGNKQFPAKMYYASNSIKDYSLQKFTDSSSGSYSPNRATLGTIRGSEHFYTPGNDLLIEYSVLWTEGITYLKADQGSYMDTRFAQVQNGDSTNKNIIYWSLSDNCSGSDCKFAGGFEWGGCDKNENDNPYPKFTKDPTLGTKRDEYPNIGGVNGGDGEDQGDQRWGWHRVSIRYRQEVTNVNEVKSGSEANYKLSLWVYIDGVLVIHSYANDFVYTPKNHPENNRDYKLFTAANDGARGIAYTDINDDLYLHGAYLHSTKMDSDKIAFFAITDYSAKIGSTFEQNVVRVDNPIVTHTVVEGTSIPTTMWYELAD